MGGDDVMVALPLFQEGSGGSIPTSPHQLKKFKVLPISRAGVKDFIEKWHYSHNINGLKISFCFGLFYKGQLVGAAIFGEPATRGVKEAYNSDGTKPVLELRRLCCIDKTPKNAESYFISKMLLWLKKNTNIQRVISYADLTYGHKGIIYKASNFQAIGKVPAGKKLLWKGKLYHNRTKDNTFNGRVKPFAQLLRKAIETGEAREVKTKEKIIYLYNIGNKAIKDSNLSSR